MATQLSQDAERRIADRVATGAFASPDAVVDEALSALEWFEERKTIERAWLEDKLARGIAQLERGEGIDGRTFFAELEAEMEPRREAAE